MRRPGTSTAPKPTGPAWQEVALQPHEVLLRRYTHRAAYMQRLDTHLQTFTSVLAARGDSAQSIGNALRTDNVALAPAPTPASAPAPASTKLILKWSVGGQV